MEILKGELLSLLLIVTACSKALFHFSLTWRIEQYSFNRDEYTYHEVFHTQISSQIRTK